MALSFLVARLSARMWVSHGAEKGGDEKGSRALVVGERIQVFEDCWSVKCWYMYFCGSRRSSYCISC